MRRPAHTQDDTGTKAAECNAGRKREMVYWEDYGQQEPGAGRMREAG